MSGLPKISSKRNILSLRDDQAPGADYEDGLPAGPTLETDADSIAFEGNAIRSQLNRIIGTGSWTDLPPAALVDISGAQIEKAGEDVLTGDLLTTGAAGSVFKATAVLASQKYNVIGIALEDALSGALFAVAGIGRKAACKHIFAPPAAQNGQLVWLATSGRADIAPLPGAGVAIVSVGIMAGADGVNLSPQIIISPQVHSFFL